MKTPSAKAKVKAFTLVELLAVVFILAIVVALLLPALDDRRRPYQAQCLMNQKQIAYCFLSWENEHYGQFPWQISSTNGGTMEAAARGYVAPNYQVLSNYLKQPDILEPNVFVCPLDKVKIAATNYTNFNNRNVSYFLNIDVSLTNNPSHSILTGDRSLKANGIPVKPGLFVLNRNLKMSWTSELHSFHGCIAFADGYVEFSRNDNLNSIVQNQPLATNRLCVP